jgi:hypothetical protein
MFPPYLTSSKSAREKGDLTFATLFLSETILKRARNLNHALGVVVFNEPKECGVDVIGWSHNPNIDCPNNDYNEYTGPYCKVQYLRKLEQ